MCLEPHTPNCTSDALLRRRSPALRRHRNCRNGPMQMRPTGRHGSTRARIRTTRSASEGSPCRPPPAPSRCRLCTRIDRLPVRRYCRIPKPQRRVLSAHRGQTRDEDKSKGDGFLHSGRYHTHRAREGDGQWDERQIETSTSFKHSRPALPGVRTSRRE